MPLIRAQKEALVEKLLGELQDSRVSVVVSYTKLHMKANNDLRTKAFEQNGKIKMISNTLLALILKKLGREMDIPSKQLAIAYGFGDEVVAAKTLVAFGKETDALEVIGGWIDGTFFDAAQVKTLSSLPGKTELQAQLVGRLGGLISSLAYSLNYPIQKFAFVVEALKSAQPASETKTEAPVADVSTEAAPSAEVATEAESAKAEEPKAEEPTTTEASAEEGDSNNETNSEEAPTEEVSAEPEESKEGKETKE